MTTAQALAAFALPHALVGTVALTSFWTAAVMKKGSVRHKAVGRVYLLAMIGVLLTALPLTLSQALAGSWVGAAFLGYLVLIVAHSCRMAWLAVRLKRDFTRYTGTAFRVSAVVLAGAGVAVSVLGLVAQSWLLVVFGLLGPIGGLEARSLVRNGPGGPDWWIKEHYGAMIGNGIATHIAFLQIGLTRLVPEIGSSAIQHLAWFAPLAVGIAAGLWLDRRHQGRRQRPGGPVSTTREAG